MIILVLLLLIVIVVLMNIIFYQKKYMAMQERSNKEYLQKWKLRHNISHNMQRLLYMSKDIKMAEKFMHEQNINVIAVYGLGAVGKNFIELIQKTDVQICYGIDQRMVKMDLKVVKPEEVKNDMDIILITAEMYYSEICNILRETVDVPIVLLSQFLDEIYLTSYWSE